MAFAVTKYRAWGCETSKQNSTEGTQYLEMTITALNTDVAYDLGETSGTFWTAVLADATYGTIATAAKAAFIDFCSRANYSLAVAGSVTASYSRGAAAAATVYTETAGTVTHSRNLAYNSTNAPTSGTIVFGWKLAPEYSVQTLNS